MGSTFTGEDWTFVRSAADSLAGRLRAVGAKVVDFAPLPPVPQQQITDFERTTGLAVPPDLSDLLTKFAGGWNFAWSHSTTKLNPLFDGPISSASYGGNFEVPFIDATTTDTLLDRYQLFQSTLRDTYAADCLETMAVLPSLLPLHLHEGGGGDYLVVRLDVSPPTIHYLDHEVAWALDDRPVGRGFREFVLGWAELGFYYCMDIPIELGLDAKPPAAENAESAVRLRRYLADPPPSDGQ